MLAAVGLGDVSAEAERKVRSKKDEVRSEAVFLKGAKNGASGMSDIEGSEPDWRLAVRVAVSERKKRASFNER